MGQRCHFLAIYPPNRHHTTVTGSHLTGTREWIHHHNGTGRQRDAVAVVAITGLGMSCREAVVLTLQSHSGVSALITVQNLEGQDIPTTSASENEGGFVTGCYRLENDDSSGDASPQSLKICKPGTFVLHITGSGKGVFDLQAKPLPEVAHPTGPLLLCNYMLDNDRAYDWVLKYQGGSRPAVFLLGSKGDPNTNP